MVIKPQRELIKKIITATAALTISLGATAQVASAAAYSDVYEGDWYYSYVQDASNKGIVSGYEDNTFRPANTITLGECLKMVLNYKGITCEKGEYHWASNYWDKAHEMGLVVWGEFDSPDKQLSRQQVARIVVRALDEDYVYFDTSLIPDYSLIGDDYKQYVVQAYAKGIISGYEDGSVIGDKAVTRAEILSILERAFNPNSRVTLDTSNRKTDIAYVRKDIDIRVNGIHTAITDRDGGWYIVQKGDEIYIPCTYFNEEIGTNYCSYTIKPCYTDVNYVSDSLRKILEEGRIENKNYYDKNWFKADQEYQWLFRNDWQVTNEITTIEEVSNERYAADYSPLGIDVDDVLLITSDNLGRYSLTFLKEHGVQVEYDAENRVVYLGEKEIKLYQRAKDANGNIYTKSTPIVDISEDFTNCAVSTPNGYEWTYVDTTQRDNCSSDWWGVKVHSCDSIAVHNSKGRESSELIINVTGTDYISNLLCRNKIYDLETGRLLYHHVPTPSSLLFNPDLTGVNYIYIHDDFLYNCTDFSIANPR